MTIRGNILLLVQSRVDNADICSMMGELKQTTYEREGDMRHELTFEQEKETKNTIRFQEVVEDGSQAVIGPLYIQKHALGSESPKTVKVTIG